MSLAINLEGLQGKFTTTGRKCAVCGRDWDDPGLEEEDDQIPLMLFKDHGKLMLTLCMEPCARARFCDDGTKEVIE